MVRDPVPRRVGTALRDAGPFSRCVGPSLPLPRPAPCLPGPDFPNNPMTQQSAYNRSLDALARRSRSTKDLERWLKEREYTQEDVADALERLTASGLLNDEKYAHSFARSRLVDRGMSRRRVAAELARHGIARDVVDRVIGSVVDDEGIDEDAAIETIARKKWRSLAKLEPGVGRRRLFGFLARKGFDGDVVQRVVRRVTAVQATLEWRPDG